MLLCCRFHWVAKILSFFQTLMCSIIQSVFYLACIDNDLCKVVSWLHTNHVNLSGATNLYFSLFRGRAWYTKWRWWRVRLHGTTRNRFTVWTFSTALMDAFIGWPLLEWIPQSGWVKVLHTSDKCGNWTNRMCACIYPGQEQCETQSNIYLAT